MSSRDTREGTMTMYEAILMVRLVSDIEGVIPPRVASRIWDGVTVADYAPESRTIALVEGRATPDTILHEFQHYLDDLHGQPLEGATRGVHDRSFYTRLDDLKARVAAVLVEKMREHADARPS